MIKKTQIIELFRIIQKTKVSFFSVVLFVMLGLSVFLGINWVITGYTDTVEYTLDTGLMEDLQIIYPYGLSDDLVEDIKGLDDVETAEGVYNAEAYFMLDGNRYQANLVMLTDTVNIPVKKTGRMAE